MKGCRARWLALACFVLAACLVYSCSEDSTTCPTPKACPNPTKTLLGPWVIFEAFQGGAPDPRLVDMELEFQDDDTLLSYGGSGDDTMLWFADDDVIIVMETAGVGMGLRFQYEFEADTLNMSIAEPGFDVLWRLLRN